MRRYEDYTSVDITAKVMEITGGEGVKAVVDGIGLATWEVRARDRRIREVGG